MATELAETFLKGVVGYTSPVDRSEDETYELVSSIDRDAAEEEELTWSVVTSFVIDTCIFP